MSALCVGFLLVLSALPGCGLFGGGPEPELVADERIVAFGQRIQGFYAELEGQPLDVKSTFEDRKLRDYFANETDFAAYYADLARQIRGRLFRNSIAVRIDIKEFRQQREDQIIVDLTFVGAHQRRLRRGDVEYARQDTWRLQGGTWLLAPERL